MKQVEKYLMVKGIVKDSIGSMIGKVENRIQIEKVIKERKETFEKGEVRGENKKRIRENTENEDEKERRQVKTKYKVINQSDYHHLRVHKNDKNKNEKSNLSGESAIAQVSIN